MYRLPDGVSVLFLNSIFFAICCKNNHFPVDVFSISFHFLHIVMWTCWIFYNTTLHSTQNTPRASKINIQFSCCAAFKRLLKVHFKFNLSLFMTLNFSSNKAKKIKAEKSHSYCKLYCRRLKWCMLCVVWCVVHYINLV